MSIHNALEDYFAVPGRHTVTAEDLDLVGILHEWEIDTTNMDRIIIRVFSDMRKPCDMKYQEMVPEWEDGVYTIQYER